MAVIRFDWMYEIAEEWKLCKLVGKCEYVLEIPCSLCSFTFGVGDFNAQCTFTCIVDLYPLVLERRKRSQTCA